MKQIRIVKLVLLFATTFATFGQRKAAPELQDYISHALSKRVELAADLLLVDLERLTLSKSEQIALLTDLYGRASEAVESFPLVLAPTPGGGSYASFIGVFGSTGQMTDALTIRLRILSRLNTLAPTKARDLYEQTTFDTPKVIQECGELAVQVVGDQYYPTLASLRLPTSVLQSPIHSLPQLAAFIQYLGHAKVPGNIDETALIIAGGLKRLTASDRVFVTAELQLQMGKNLEILLQREELSGSVKGIIASEYRTFVLRHLKQPRCGDIVRKGEDLLLKPTLKRLDDFAAQYQIHRTDPKEIPLPEYIAGPVSKRPPLDQTSDFPSDLDRYEKRGTDEDRARVEADIDAISKLQPSDCKLCDLATRVGSLIFFVSRLGDDRLSEHAFSTALSIVALNPAKNTNPGLWIYVAKQLVNLTHHPSPGISQYASKLLAQTIDQDLAVYAEHERLFGRSTAYVKDALTKSDAFVAVF